MEEHPDELKPYIGMMDILLNDLHEPEEAKHIYRLGMDNFKKDEDKEVLAKMYHAFQEQAESPMQLS
jgi:hypothetical protein